MSVTAEQVQIGVVKEVTYGVTPATPQFEVLPIASESLAPNAEVSDSNLMRSNRQRTDNKVRAFSPGGDLVTTLHDSAAFRILLESALCDSLALVPAASEPPGAPINPNLHEGALSTTRISFTVEKRFPDPQNPGQFLYQRITGVVVDVMGIVVNTNGDAEVTFTTIGKDFTTAESAIAGSTYVEPPNTLSFQGADVVTLTLDSLVDISGEDCTEGLNITLSNNDRGRRCLGLLGNKEVLLGEAMVDITLQAMYMDNDLLNALLAQTEHVLSVQLSMPAATGVQWFAADCARVKVSGDPVLATGKNADVFNDLALSALYDVTDATTVKMQIGTGATS